MNPEGELSRLWAEVGRMSSSMAETLALLPLLPELEETLRLAALKRGSRRPHGGLRGFW